MRAQAHASRAGFEKREALGSRCAPDRWGVDEGPGRRAVEELCSLAMALGELTAAATSSIWWASVATFSPPFASNSHSMP